MPRISNGPFVSYNAELLEMLNTQFLNVLDERQALASLREQVKWILKRLVAGSRPDIPAVALELGLSPRTLQRRIVEEGASFRQLLLGRSWSAKISPSPRCK